MQKQKILFFENRNILCQCRKTKKLAQIKIRKVIKKEVSIVNNGEIAAVIIEDEATLKRVYYYPEKGKLILNPENPLFEPLVYINEELNTIRIIGKAVAVIKKL